jgi:hypothetical protein
MRMWGVIPSTALIRGASAGGFPNLTGHITLAAMWDMTIRAVKAEMAAIGVVGRVGKRMRLCLAHAAAEDFPLVRSQRLQALGAWVPLALFSLSISAN